MDKIYDVIILGAGPAGLAAGLYAGRARLDTLVIEKGKDGGQIAITDEIENYPGQMVDEKESGPSLIARMTKQVEKFGAARVSDTITSVELEGDVKVLKSAKNEYRAKVVIVAPALSPSPSAVRTRPSSWARASPSAPPATLPSSRTSRSLWWAAATPPWKRPCT